jgi:RimJ/RimL family protein N-acetyltransferase
MKIVLETERLILRELDPADAGELSKVLSDGESMIHYPHPFSMAEVKDWIERNIKRYHDPGFGLWAVVRKEDNAFIGDCGITIQNIDGETLPEIGFHVIGEYRGMGYASEAAAACRNYAFEKLGYLKVYSYTRAGNLPSQRVSLKIGMSGKKRFEKDGISFIVFECEKK